MPIQYAQSVCLNGHQASDNVSWGVQTTGFCDKCGTKLISICPSCKNPIPGSIDPNDYNSDVFILSGPTVTPVPKYCNSCGKPYPWTQSAIDSAKELIEMSELDSTDKESFNESIPDLLVDTPKTKLAITKFKIYTSKIGSGIADGLKEVLVDVVSETVKRAIWGV